MSRCSRPHATWWIDGIEIYLKKPCDGKLNDLSIILSCLFQILQLEQPTKFINIFLDNIDSESVSLRLFFAASSRIDYQQMVKIFNSGHKEIQYIVKHYPAIKNFTNNLKARQKQIESLSEEKKTVQRDLEQWLKAKCCQLNLTNSTISG